MTTSVVFVASAYDITTPGSPGLAGLSPTWHCLYDANTKASLLPWPAPIDVGGGQYSVTAPDTATGFINWNSGSAWPLYTFMPSVSVQTVGLTDGSGIPLAGQSPAVASVYNTATGTTPSTPSITEIGLGCYSIPMWQNVYSGIVDGGTGANPQHQQVPAGTNSSVAGPIITDFTPAPGTPIGPLTPLTFTIQSALPLTLVTVSAQFGAVSELAYDSTQAQAVQPLYSALSYVSGSLLSGALTITLARTLGWPAPYLPSLTIHAVDSAGNIG